MFMSVLAASLVISIPAYGENVRDYSKNLTLAINPKPLPIGFDLLDRKEVSSKRIDLAASPATMKLKITPTFVTTGIDDIQKDDEAVSPRPKLGVSTILGQLTAGMFLGIATSGALGLFFKDYDIRYILGYPLGAALGARLVVCRKNWTGSFLKALVGAYLGIPVSYSLIWFGFYVLELGHGSEWAWLGVPAVLAPVPILSTILLNASLRYKNPPAKLTSFLNVRDGGIRLDFPAVQVVPEHGITKNWRWTVALASIEL